MMSTMQRVSKRQRVEAGPTEEFVELCAALYGDFVDPDAIWSDVVKMSPDQADTNAGAQAKKKPSKFLTDAAVVGNAAGMVAGPAAIYSAVKHRKDGGIPRDIGETVGGKLSQSKRPRLKATGERMTRVADKLNSPKGRRWKGGAKAAGAGLVGLQGVNWGVDILSTKLLRDQQEKEKVGKVNPKRVGAGIKAATTRKLTATGVQTPTLPKAAIPQGVPKAAMPMAVPKARPAPSRAGQVARRDVNAAMSTTTGKVTAGVTVATGARATMPKRADPYAPYGKSAEYDIEFAGEFSKFDDEKQQAFGWASVITKNGQPVIDKQGDYIAMEDLEEAAYTYVHKSRVGGDMHRRNGEAAHKVSDMIESMVFTPEKIAKMGLPDDFPQGWWVGYQIHDPETWAEVRKKGRTGFSIHGRGIRRDTDIDSIMGYSR